MRKLLMAIIVFCVAGQAFGLTPLGPPAAMIDQGLFEVGFGYSKSKGDIKLEALGIKEKARNVEVNTYMANLVFGIVENLELQVDLGVSDTEYESETSKGDFAWGFVLRTTLGQTDEITWGGVGSVHWYTSTDSGEDFGFQWTEKDKWTEIQFAVGPTWERDQWCLYGGPFLHYINGEGKVRSDVYEYSGDFEEDSSFGGFVGARIEIAKNTALGIEYQRTGSANAVGASVLWRF